MQKQDKNNQLQGTMSRYLLSFYRDWFSEICGRCDVLITKQAVYDNGLEMVTDTEDVLINISHKATGDISFDDDCIAFTVRFSGVSRHMVLHYYDIVGVRNPETLEIVPIDCLPVLMKDGQLGLKTVNRSPLLQKRNKPAAELLVH